MALLAVEIVAVSVPLVVFTSRKLRINLGPAEPRQEKGYAFSTIKCNTGKHKKKRKKNLIQ